MESLLNQKKINPTIILIGFFILGFFFNYAFDLGILSISQKNNAFPKELNESTSMMPVASIGLGQQIVSINDIIRAQEEKETIPKDNFIIIADQNPNFLPIRDWTVPFIELSAKSAIAVDNKASRIFYQKNIFDRLPIASLTKLMTAVVVTENTDLKEVAAISAEAVAQEGNAGGFIVGEKESVENLLKALLLESSNDAALALKEHFNSVGVDMIDLMNQKAKSLGLKDTKFSSPSGLEDRENYSTAYDLSRLVAYSLENKKIWDILILPISDIKSENSYSGRRLINNNFLLGKISGIIGGKTGFTLAAGGCFLSATKLENNSIIITIVLGSDDRFGETEKLINWVKSAYRFNN